MPIVSPTQFPIEFSPMAMGCWAFAGGDLWGTQVEGDSIAVIRTAFDLGIKIFDTAPGYGDGESERVLGLGLSGLRDQAIVATKISGKNLSRNRLIESCERSLKLLRTDRIDLMQVHWPNRSVPFEETIEALSQLKENGKIRNIGVCNFGIEDMRDWLSKGGEMVSNQLPYSLLFRAIEFEIIPECREKGVTVLSYCPLMQGLLTGKFKTVEDVPEGRTRSRHFRGDRPLSRHGEQGCEDATFKAINAIRKIADEVGVSTADLALAWLVAQPSVGSVLAGARNIEQLRANAGCLELGLDDALIHRLEEATLEVKSHLGSNPDLWQSESRFR